MFLLDHATDTSLDVHGLTHARLVGSSFHVKVGVAATEETPVHCLRMVEM
jgi:hypothetical protein